MSLENFSPRQKNRAALHRDVRSICTETCHLLGLDITKQSTDVITELVYKKILLYGSDLEAFARHAKRSTISADDVKLLTRRNPSLKEHLACLSSNSTVKKQRRKTTNKSEVGAERTVESLKKIDNDTTNKTDEMETDHSEVFANNPTNAKTCSEIKDGVATEPPARTNETELNETIDLTFD